MLQIQSAHVSKLMFRRNVCIIRFFKFLVEIRSFNAESGAHSVHRQNSFEKRCMRLLFPDENFARVNRRRTEKKIFTSIIEIAEYPAAILRQGRESRADLARSREIDGKPWRIYKRAYRARNNA